MGNPGRTALFILVLCTTLFYSSCTTAEKEYERGIRLSMESRHEEALLAFDQALKSRPEDPCIHDARAATLRSIGRLPEAREAYAEMRRTLARELERRPNDEQGFFRLGMSYHGSGLQTEAIRAFDRVIELNADHTEAHLFRGVSLANHGRHREALEAFDRAIVLNPRSVMAHDSRGWSLGNLGRTEEALRAFDRALEVDPHSGYFNRGRVLALSGRHEEAVSAFDHVIQSRPQSRGAHRHRGESLEALGRYEEGERAYFRAAGIGAYGAIIDPMKHNPTLHFLRGRAFAKMGRHKDAIEAFDLAMRLRANYAEASAARQNLLETMTHKE